ncbi:NAD-dependent epimerase/dehydratase family protein [Aestuariivirga sp.]|uniref:NAD-dependent epimerase/dehydratase family protein n=1 Tax=Aestuariivirga sp. TaxID=2650926 RepID=UPI00391DF304
MARQVIVTGGSGKAGRHVIRFLVGQGHTVLNLDARAEESLPCRTLVTDIRDGTQVFSALSSYLGAEDPAKAFSLRPADAVIHLAAIPRMFAVADPEVMKVNVLGTYNVLESARKLGIRKIILASSEAAYGFAYSERIRAPRYFPVDEEHPLSPTDAYGLSKLLNEETARAFAGQYQADIYVLRIGDVIVPEDHAKFRNWFRTPETRMRFFWSYIDARDLGQMVHLALERDGLGFQVFNAANDHTSSDIPNKELLARFFPGVPQKHALGPFETLLANRRIRDVLGFREEHAWRNYVPGP